MGTLPGYHGQTVACPVVDPGRTSGFELVTIPNHSIAVRLAKEIKLN